jgi:hypothetical protein
VKSVSLPRRLNVVHLNDTVCGVPPPLLWSSGWCSALVALTLVLELLEFVLEVVTGPTPTLLALVVLSLVAYALVAGSGG